MPLNSQSNRTLEKNKANARTMERCAWEMQGPFSNTLILIGNFFKAS